MSAVSAEPRAERRQVKKAIGPRLRMVFFGVLALLAMSGDISVYLAGVTFLEVLTKRTFLDYF
ncbi:MAG: hypothetical protein ACK5YC_24670 [Planctomyces sp.]